MNAEQYQPRIRAIAKRIKELRVAAGYKSYEDFAVQNDLDRKQYWRMEQGQNFKIISLLRIVDAHGMTMQDFFDGIK